MLPLAASCTTRQQPNVRVPAPPPGQGIRAVLVASGLSSPVDLTAPPGDTGRVFLVEKVGRIRIVKNGQLLPRPFLDISSRVSRGSEQGLLGLAFHPQSATNRAYYVNYTDTGGDTRVVEFLASAADPDTTSGGEREILFVDQPFSNHNGGQVLFGPDGNLYIPLGDGGSGGDPLGSGQNLGSLLGKILRIAVAPGSAAPYATPAGNPFVGRPGARAEIWDYGVRNPWRCSFDRGTGDLYIADVGQNAWEEVNHERAGTGGRNYGWNIMEGNHCYAAASCDDTGLTAPVQEYSHGEGCSVTGGAVYRGAAIPSVRGHYFYGDFCSGFIRSFTVVGGSAADPRDWTTSLRTQAGGDMTGLSSFGEDARGELYVVLLGGEVYRIEAAP